MTIGAVTAQLDRVINGDKVAFFSNFSKQGFELLMGNVDSFTAILAHCVVMVGGEYFAQLDLGFKAVPNAVYNAQALE